MSVVSSKMEEAVRELNESFQTEMTIEKRQFQLYIDFKMKNYQCVLIENKKVEMMYKNVTLHGKVLKQKDVKSAERIECIKTELRAMEEKLFGLGSGLEGVSRDIRMSMETILAELTCPKVQLQAPRRDLEEEEKKYEQLNIRQFMTNK